MSETTITAPITGSVFRLLLEEGAAYDVGDELLILESMKMEIPVIAEEAGTVSRYLVAEGDAVEEGQPLVACVSRPA